MLDLEIGLLIFYWIELKDLELDSRQTAMSVRATFDNCQITLVCIYFLTLIWLLTHTMIETNNELMSEWDCFSYSRT